MKALAAVLVSGMALLEAELPDAYRAVARVMFVVPDADRAATAWAGAGIPIHSVRPLDGVYARRAASALFENVVADFIEPGTKGPLRDYLSRHSGGVFALVHRFADALSLESELARLAQLGVKPVLDVTWHDRGRFVFLDTYEAGKYSLALAVMPEYQPPLHSRRITQYAFVVKDLEATSAWWAKLGLPAMTYTHPDCSELVYRGKPGTFDMRVGWQRHGKVVYEWIQPLRGPATYYDHLEKHGEGLHHLAVSVSDMDQGIGQWFGFGFPMVMGGAWGEKGKPGSGRFAYHDLDRCCGIEIELLWNFSPR
jgi:catechol 2,3-dioxygenase-like lactoylglutathione lyase family enzyme